MSNILFVLYHDFSANSAIHVHHFANHLTDSGHNVAVAIPQGDETGPALGEQLYQVCFFPEVDGNWSHLFRNGLPPDVLHAWTPRENVRLFCEKIRGLCSPLLFVHLEDNEERILEVNLGRPFEEIAKSKTVKLPGNLIHPNTYRHFLSAADGVTLIMDRLGTFVPAGVPTLILWPGADQEVFFPREKDHAYLASLGVPRENIVLCYNGNVHSANGREVRSLYLAAAILQREGIPTTLLRAGRDFCSFLGPDETWAHAVSIDLGYVKHVDMPPLLALADFLVQPGANDPFNEYRLPAKLPEFFATARPVILPLSNVGRFVRHGEEAWVLPKVDALAIVEAVNQLRSDESLLAKLSTGARAFAREQFDWKTNTGKLDRFYHEILTKMQSQSHDFTTAAS
jgi:glycosyltransferase involved in cell wall biosynthesis